ncbi:DUF2878 domain-containing protein [Lysobacter niabensis]|uniref:DUF2878 domain-containing protein n=1 Tax=Agrilutibacter niabensis TaxID=380628 RepID=UPI00360C8988
MPLIANAFGYQVVWLVAVIGAGQGRPVWGISAAGVFVVAQWVTSKYRAADAFLIVLSLALGVCLDGLLSLGGWLSYASPAPALVAPAWILAIWAAFAMTFNHSLRFLQGRPAWALALGAMGGPLAYWSAARGFDAVQWMASPVQIVAVLALTWAAVVAVLAEAARIWRVSIHASAKEWR